MSSKKRKNRKAEPKRRPFPWIKTAAVIVSLLTAASVAALVGARDSRKDEAAKMATAAATATATAIPAKRPDRTDELYAKLDRAIAAVRMVAKGDPYAEALVEKFVRYAVPFYPVPDKQGTSIKGVRLRQAIDPERMLKVVFVASEEVYLVPKRVESPFFYDPDMKALVCIDFGALHEDMAGVMYLHELVHWDGFMTGREKPRSDVLSDASVRGELFAHDVETRAYDRITGGDFIRRMRLVLADDRLSYKESPDGLRRPTAEGESFLMSMWSDPPLSKEDGDCRESLFMVPLAIMQARDERERMAAYRDIRRVFQAQDLRKGY
jgi:hypothetical protein